MAYGSGNSKYREEGGFNSGYQGSYQAGGSSYQPPAAAGASYAQQQTNVMEDTMRTHYEVCLWFQSLWLINSFSQIIKTYLQTEGTAATVLAQMTTQRQQLEGASDNVWQMRQAAQKAKDDITLMANRQRAKKMRLQMIAAGLALIDFLLFIRLIQCGGGFFCKSSSSSSSSNYYYGNWYSIGSY